MSKPHPYTYTLYTFFGSSCTARVRIACAHKNIPLTYKFVRLHKGEQLLPRYIAQVNSSGSVPALMVYCLAAPGTSTNGNEGIDNGGDARSVEPIAIITQSIAIIEYFDETFPTDIKLLPPPSEPLLRAKVRELVNVIVCDVQPLTNMRVFKHVGSLVEEAQGSGRGDTGITSTSASREAWSEDAWQHHFMTLGLSAYEALVVSSAGRFSVGDTLTLADICLVAAMDRAIRYNVDLSKYPTVQRVDAEIRKLECYKAGGWKSQPDTFRSLAVGAEGKL